MHPESAPAANRKSRQEPQLDFETLVSSVKDYAIFMLDPNGRVMTWNDGAHRIKGYTEAEIVGKHFSTFYTQEAQEIRHPERELEIAKAEGRYEEEGWRVRKDGTVFWASVVITAVRDQDHLIGFLKVTCDLSERKAAEQSDQNFRLLVSSVKEYAIFMLDPLGNVRTWNEGAKRIKGYTEDEIIGKHFSVFYTQESKDIGHPERELEVARKQGRYQEEGWRIRKDGSLFWASVVITAVRDKDGKLVGFTKVTHDLTDRKAADEQLRLAAKLLQAANEELKIARDQAIADRQAAEEALQIKTRFLSTISHEVRTPMAGIIGLTELLTCKEFDRDTDETIQTVFESSKRLLQILNDLLEAAKLESGKVVLERRNFPLRALIGEVRQLISPEALKKELTVLGTCDNTIPELVCGDELRVRQVLLNLAFNAVKFTHHGSVSISAKLLDINADRLLVRFSVTDTGIGIAKEDQARIFTPFEQGQSSTARVFGGTGLGLSISRTLVQLMDGEISFTSEAGVGSTFYFDVPFSHCDK